MLTRRGAAYSPTAYATRTARIAIFSASASLWRCQTTRADAVLGVMVPFWSRARFGQDGHAGAHSTSSQADGASINDGTAELSKQVHIAKPNALVRIQPAALWPCERVCCKCPAPTVRSAYYECRHSDCGCASLSRKASWSSDARRNDTSLSCPKPAFTGQSRRRDGEAHVLGRRGRRRAVLPARCCHAGCTPIPFHLHSTHAGQGLGGAECCSSRLQSKAAVKKP